MEKALTVTGLSALYRLAYGQLMAIQTDAETLLQQVQENAVNWNAVFLEQAFPVGTILYTTDGEMSPASLLGGTWARSEEGVYTVAAGDTYALGSTGGEAAVVLSVAQMPSHTHTYTSNLDSFKALEDIEEEGYWAYNTSSNTGGGQAHNNLPPSLRVVEWERTA